tara:strand:+ start:632 stop:781 length:150 start_codon:yes stop_codon:yes gene_type:complete
MHKTKYFIIDRLSNAIMWDISGEAFVMSDGSILISDNKYNAISKVTYKG